LTALLPPQNRCAFRIRKVGLLGWTLGKAEKRKVAVFTKHMKSSRKLTPLLTLQLILLAFVMPRSAFAQASPLTLMALNQANALNNELFQSQWGQRVSGAADGDVGPVNGTTLSDKNGKNPILVANVPSRWNFFVEGNGIFAQAPGYQTHYNINGGGVTTGLSYQWTPSITTGLYVGYQGSQLSHNVTFVDGFSFASDKFLVTDNAARFGLFGSYGQTEGKGLYGLGLVGGTYHQYTFSDKANSKFSNSILTENFSDNANSSPGAPELDSMLQGGYDFKAGGFTFGPMTGVQYTYIHQNEETVAYTGNDQFTFSGQQFSSHYAYQTRYPWFDTSTLLYNLGVHAAYTWKPGKDLVVVPQISLNWQHEFFYLVNGMSINTEWPDALYTGVGVTADYKKRYSASFFYNCYACNQDLISQNIFLSLGVNF
jgi:hypothetical protein